MHAIRLKFLLITMALLLPCGAAWAAKRVALVVGNSDYEHVARLANPVNDANDIADKLRQLGFEVIQGNDRTFPELRDDVRRFIAALTGADLALFYYAGHGLQVKGKNYVAPVDARLASYDDLAFEAMPIDFILSAMERKTKTNLIFLDACRSNPLARNLARSMGTRSADVGRGLARLSSGIGTLLAFSTQPGNVALDGTGRNSPFTRALVRHLGTPGEDITRTMRRVRADVIQATEGKQVPWENSSLTGDIILKAAPAESDAVQIQPQPDPGPTADEAVQAAIKVNTPRAWDLLKRKFGPSVMERSDVVRVFAEAEQQGPPAQSRERSLGLNKAQRQRVQTALNDAGYSVGSPDGVWGSKTRAGIRALQSDLGIENSGFANEAVLDHLGVSIPRADDGTFVNASFAMSHDPDALRLLGEDERIVEIVECLGRRRSVYGRQGNSVYFVVISSLYFNRFARLFEECGGYPASITSKEENDFIYSLIADEVEFFRFGYNAKTGYSGKEGPFFGMVLNAGKQNGSWRWYNGEEVGFTNWQRGRPSSSNPGQKNAHFYALKRGRSDLKDTDASQWSDNSGISAKSAVMEVDF